MFIDHKKPLTHIEQAVVTALKELHKEKPGVARFSFHEVQATAGVQEDQLMATVQHLKRRNLMGSMSKGCWLTASGMHLSKQLKQPVSA
jgi:hypothetical protein